MRTSKTKACSASRLLPRFSAVLTYSFNRMIVSLTKISPIVRPRDGIAYNSGGTPISARYSSPTLDLACTVSSPVFGKASVNVAVARIQGFPGIPLVVSNPEGVSNASTGQPEALMLAIQAATDPWGLSISP